MNSKTLIIHNPRAGVKKKVSFPELVTKLGFTKENGFEYQPTQYAGHASELAKKAIEENYSTVAVAGGDGTVNEVARELAHTNVNLAIIPMGSGNGLARHMHITLDWGEALQLLKTGKTTKVDVGDANGHKFFCAAGIGFDAEVSKAFETSTTRGLKSYIYLGTLQYLKYSPKQYQFSIDSKQYNLKAFIISIANAAQFGNDAFISPKSINDDGILECCIIKPYPVIAGFKLFRSLFNKTIETSKYYTSISGKEIYFKLNEPSLFHCDGEVFEAENELNITIEQQALNIIVDKNKKP